MKTKTIIIGNNNYKKIDNSPENIFWEPQLNERILNDISKLNNSVWDKIELLDIDNNLKYVITVEKI